MAIQIIFEAVDRAALSTIQKVAKGLDGVTESSKNNNKETSLAGNVWGGLVGGMTAANLITSVITKSFQFLNQQLKESVKAAQESELALARTEATLLSTGRAAEISGTALANISMDLSGGTMFDDEQILEAMNALARFDSVATSSLPDVTRVAMDMAAALGTDVPTAANQLGGALETGVIPRAWKFDAATKSNIKNLISEGKESEALGEILDKLGQKFEGQAAKMGSTTAGGAAQAKNALENLKEEIGKGMLPALENMYSATVRASDGWRQLVVYTNNQKDVSTETENILNQVGMSMEINANATRGNTVAIDGMFAANETATKAAKELAETQLFGAEAMRQGRITADELAAKVKKLGETLGMTPEQIQATIDIVINGKKELEQVQQQIIDFGNQEQFDFILNFQAKSDDFDKTREEILGKMAKLKDDIIAAQAEGDIEALPGLREDMVGLTNDLNQNEAAFKQWQKQAVFSMIQTKLSADGLTDAEFGQLLGIGENMGLLDSDVVAQAQGLMNTLSGVDTSSLDKATNDIKELISQDGRTIKLYVEQTVTTYDGGNAPAGGSAPTGGHPGGGGTFASGGYTLINYGVIAPKSMSGSDILAEFR